MLCHPVIRGNETVEKRTLHSESDWGPFPLESRPCCSCDLSDSFLTDYCLCYYTAQPEPGLTEY